jgi:hypothetical protein
MSSIKTYEDLEVEEKRLQALLYSHKENIKDSFANVKKGLNPFRNVISTVTKLFHRDRSNPITKIGVDLGLDVLLRKFILAKSGWFTKIIVPFFIKNYSTHFVKEYKKSKLLQRIRNLFKQSKNNVQDTAEEVNDSLGEVNHTVPS